MKDYIWVIEVKRGARWKPIPHDTSFDRGTARVHAKKRRMCGYETRIRKYVRAE